MQHQPQPGTLIDFGPFRYDKALGKLSKHGTPIRLRGMPLKILHHLVERPGEVVSRRELQNLLWTGTAFGDFEQGLNSAVNVVRKTLSDSAEQARYLETVPGQGYRFIATIRFAVVAPETHASNGALDLVSKVVPEIRETPIERKLARPESRWWVAAAFALAAFGCGAWWTFHSRPRGLIDGSMPSAKQEANDQYNLAFNFLAFQSDIPLARKTFEHALELDPDFAAARLQRALMTIIDIYNGYANDGSILLQAEEDLHQAEKTLPASDGLLLGAQAGVYLAQGRLDRIPVAKMNEWWRSKGGNEGSPVWVVILRMLKGQTEEPLAILRAHLERVPMEGPSRMLLGEILRTQGNTAGAIQVLERTLQQSPRHPAIAWFLTMAYLDGGKPERARTMLEGMRLEFGKNYMWRHAWAILLASEGKHKEALQAMDEDTLKFARLTWAVTSSTADLYALIGEQSKAIEWLQLAIARGDERVSYLRRNPRLTMLRDDPRFQSILKSLEARGK